MLIETHERELRKRASIDLFSTKLFSLFDFFSAFLLIHSVAEHSTLTETKKKVKN